MKKILFVLYISLCFSLNLTLIDYHDPQAHHILDAEIYENTLIVSGYIQGIELYDVSNSGQLNHLSHFTLSGGGGGGGGTKVIVFLLPMVMHILHLIMVYMLLIFLIQNPINNGSVSGTNNFILENLKAKDNVLIVACHEDGARIYDISNHLIQYTNLRFLQIILGQLSLKMILLM